MLPFALYLFGSPRVTLDGREIHIPRRKAIALLAYLATTKRTHSRDALAVLLWPDSDQSSALANLRRVLSDLNKSLGRQWFTVDRDTAALNH